MFSTIVSVRRLDDSRILKPLLWLIPWVLGIFICMGFIGQEYYIFVPIMFLIFLSIIPLTIYMVKSARKAKEEAFYEKEVTFYIEDGKLYTDGIKLTITSDAKEGVLFLENCKVVNTRYARNVVVTNFCGRVEGQYAQDLAYFLQKNGIKIKSWEKYLRDLEDGTWTEE